MTSDDIVTACRETAASVQRLLNMVQNVHFDTQQVQRLADEHEAIARRMERYEELGMPTGHPEHFDHQVGDHHRSLLWAIGELQTELNALRERFDQS